MKRTVEIILAILIIYLIISSMYILLHINFGEEPKITGPGFSGSTNIIRVIMGLPKVYTTYEGVSPIFLTEVVIKIVLAIFLINILRKGKKKLQE